MPLCRRSVTDAWRPYGMRLYAISGAVSSRTSRTGGIPPLSSPLSTPRQGRDRPDATVDRQYGRGVGSLTWRFLIELISPAWKAGQVIIGVLPVARHFVGSLGSEIVASWVIVTEERITVCYSYRPRLDLDESQPLGTWEMADDAGRWWPGRGGGGGGSEIGGRLVWRAHMDFAFPEAMARRNIRIVKDHDVEALQAELGSPSGMIPVSPAPDGCSIDGSEPCALCSGGDQRCPAFYEAIRDVNAASRSAPFVSAVVRACPVFLGKVEGVETTLVGIESWEGRWRLGYVWARDEGGRRTPLHGRWHAVDDQDTRYVGAPMEYGTASDGYYCEVGFVPGLPVTARHISFSGCHGFEFKLHLQNAPVWVADTT